jgi:hypothetical protein
LLWFMWPPLGIICSVNRLRSQRERGIDQGFDPAGVTARTTPLDISDQPRADLARQMGWNDGQHFSHECGCFEERKGVFVVHGVNWPGQLEPTEGGTYCRLHRDPARSGRTNGHRWPSPRHFGFGLRHRVR